MGNLVGRRSVIDSDGRPAAIDAGTAFVANLRLDPGKAGKTRNPVRAIYPSLVEKVVVQLAITVDLAALFQHLQKQIDLSLVLVGSLTQRAPQPSIKSTGMTPQKATHRPHRKLQAMQGNERVFHFASLAKYAAAYFRMSRSSVMRASSFFSRLISSA